MYRHYLRSETSAIFRHVPRICSLAEKDYEESQVYPLFIDLLRQNSDYQAKKEISPAQTALFVLCLRDALYDFVKDNFRQNIEVYQDVPKDLNELVDHVTLLTFDYPTQTREAIISEQTNAIWKLSTPIIKLRENTLLLPLIGMVDNARAPQRSQMVYQFLFVNTKLTWPYSMSRASL